MGRTTTVLALRQRDDLRHQLLAWFADIKRDLPWRRTGDLYGIWISEIMLQQTTVAAVVPFWSAFMKQFPTVEALASAEESDVLAAWSGLGYYTRARNLHRAAKFVCADLSGCLPSTREQWLMLPGVGPYAAGAIASIGLNECVPAMDANARRVILRWAAQDPMALAELSATARNRLVDEFGASLVPCDQPAPWNEALMELGALVCRARQADCHKCPVKEYCAAFAGQWSDEVPPPKSAAKSQPVWLGLAVVSWRDRILLLPPQSPPLAMQVQKRKVAREDFSGLHKGMWSLPGTVWLQGHSAPTLTTEAWLTHLPLPQKMRSQLAPQRLVGQVRHAITTYRLNVSVVEFVIDGRLELSNKWCGSRKDLTAPEPTSQGLFFDLAGDAPPISQLTRKAWQLQRDAID